MIEIRAAREPDWGQIWPIFKVVIEAADSFVYEPDTPQEIAHEIWMAPGNSVYVAVDDVRIVGSYLLKQNHPGLGSHIANAAYMVHPEHAGRGIGRLMGEHSLAQAKEAEFRAMQFNIVVSTNEPAVRLWKSLGFHIIGTIPQAFRHGALGLVDAYIMYRSLE
jgi:ribosomal protein S18 acetylase RimI-like enzyme